MCTDTTLENVTGSSAKLSDGEELSTRTVVWTAGVKPSPVVAHLGLPRDEQGRIGRPHDGRPSLPTGAERAGVGDRRLRRGPDPSAA